MPLPPASASSVSFSGTIASTPVTNTYRLGLAVVAAAMLLLPLVYLALIGVVAWGVWWHLTTDTWLLSGTGGKQWRLLLYATPALAGVVLIFFMIKPFLARRASRRDVVTVQPGEQPELFELIRGICSQVGAPMPVRVAVDCEINASASFGDGAFAFLRRDLVLTIGLPLVAGLSARELAGVLAHEFGHFAQAGGMRLTSTVRGINLWLLRVVHERDEWDMRLAAWAKESDWRLGAALSVARAAVWLSRRVLAGLAWVGNAVSCFMLRQMEYDADSYEVKIAGSEAFARTMVRLRELGLGSQVAFGQMRQSFEDRVLPANLPLLFADHSLRLPAAARAVVESPSGPTGLLDTHPSDGDRLAAAHAAAAAGALLGGDDPATTLFRDFDTLSAATTRHHYEHVLGVDLAEVVLASASETRQTIEKRERAEDALREFFGGRLSRWRPLRLPVADVAGLDVPALMVEIGRTSTEIAGPQVASAETYRAYEQYCIRHEQAFCAEQLLLAKVKTIDAERFALAEPTLAGAQSTMRWADEEREKLRPALEAFETSAARSLACRIALAAHLHPARDLRPAALALDAVADGVALSLDGRRAVVAVMVLGTETAAEWAAFTQAATERFAKAALESRQRVSEAVRRAADLGAGEPETAAACARLLEAETKIPASEYFQRTNELYLSLLMRVVTVATESSQASA